MDKNDMPAGELPNAGVHGGGQGSQVGYKVEVRSSYWEPSIVGDFVIDNVWRSLEITRGPTPWGTNIPVKSWHSDMLDHGLVSKEVAEAHRCCFIAYLEASRITASLCIETRLVQIKYHYTFRLEEIGVSEPEKRSSWTSGKTPFHPRLSSEEVPLPEDTSTRQR